MRWFDAITLIFVEMLIRIFLTARACSDADGTANRVIISNDISVAIVRDCSRGTGAGTCALAWCNFSYFCRYAISEGIRCSAAGEILIPVGVKSCESK